MAAYIGDIIAGQQYLGDWQTKMCKETIPQAHEPALSDRCEGLWVH